LGIKQSTATTVRIVSTTISNVSSINHTTTTASIITDSRIQVPQVIQHPVQLQNYSQLPIPQLIPSVHQQQSINSHQPLQLHPTYVNVSQLQPFMYVFSTSTTTSTSTRLPPKLEMDNAHQSANASIRTWMLDPFPHELVRTPAQFHIKSITTRHS
jgi:hypothetical protein